MTRISTGHEILIEHLSLPILATTPRVDIPRTRVVWRELELVEGVVGYRISELWLAQLEVMDLEVTGWSRDYRRGWLR